MLLLSFPLHITDDENILRRLFSLLKPLGDRLVLEQVESEEKTAGGIVLPDSAQEKPQEGRVVAVGAGAVKDNGERVAPEVNEGDIVVYSKFAGTEVKYDGREYLIVRESDILAVVQ
jgi:chaperonin GroES